MAPGPPRAWTGCTSTSAIPATRWLATRSQARPTT
jgi:hypothetical protein